MKLIGNSVNGEFLESLLLSEISNISEIKAAVAYANGSPKLFDFAFSKNIKLTFYGRYDQSLPVSLPILKRFLDKKSLNFRCYLVPDIFHAKVIWFVGKGVYIGSANLTDPAWHSNIEMGTFFDQDDIVSNDMELELIDFFSFLEKPEVSKPLTEEIYRELEEFQRNNKRFWAEESSLSQKFNEIRSIPKNEGLTFINKKTYKEKAKQSFLDEWNSTLQLIRDIASRITKDENRPSWITSSVPGGVQVDQFLHAYYYNLVRNPDNKTEYRFEEFHQRNCASPDKALSDAISWWKNLKEAPSGESEHIDINAVKMLEYLDPAKLLHLTEDDFIDLCTSFYAFTAVARQVKNSKLNLPANSHQDIISRSKILAKKIWQSRSSGGFKVNEVINYVLWGGDKDRTPDRLWEATQRDGDYHIEHFGLSCLGELIGWGRPNNYPPRNGRTSKALYALGNKVKIHTI